MEAIDHDPRNPCRVLSWRWLRALALGDAGRRPGLYDDAWVRRARRFQRVVAQSGGDRGHPRVVRGDPELHAAWGLRGGVPQRRWELEARLLAGQGDAAVAAATGIPEAVAAAYEATFYAVRDRLGALDWVQSVILGGGGHGGIAADDVERLWKVCAYSLGPAALGALMAASRPAGGDDATRPPADPTGLVAGPIGLLVAAMGLRGGERSAGHVLALDAWADEAERELAGRSAAPVCGPLATSGWRDPFPGLGTATLPVGGIVAAPREMPPGWGQADLEPALGCGAMISPMRFPDPPAPGDVVRRDAG